MKNWSMGFIICLVLGLFPVFGYSDEPVEEQGNLSDVSIEYIGFSSFIIGSPGGQRILIDPFNSTRWIGLTFPANIEEPDATIITHPHFDHDASYYFSDHIPVFREPGRYSIGDVKILGVKGKHGGAWAGEVGNYNTMFVIETGGLRIAHLGDNGPLTGENIRAIGDIDVLIIRHSEKGTIMTDEEVDALRKSLKAAITIPMHYQHDGYPQPTAMGSIKPWLKKQERVSYFDRNVIELRAPMENAPQVIHLPPSPDLKTWPDTLFKAYENMKKAKDLLKKNDSTQALALMRDAYDSTGAIVFAFKLADTLAKHNKQDEAVSVLEKALVRAQRDDWEMRMRSRTLLAGLYQSEDKLKDAAIQYGIVLHNGDYPALVKKAKVFFSSYASK